MPQDWSQRKEVPPYVRVGTIRDMAAVAKNLGMIRVGIEEIKKIEDKIESESDPERVRGMNRSVGLIAFKVQEWSDDSIDILQKMKRNVEIYLRDLKNAID